MKFKEYYLNETEQSQEMMKKLGLDYKGNGIYKDKQNNEFKWNNNTKKFDKVNKTESIEDQIYDYLKNNNFDGSELYYEFIVNRHKQFMDIVKPLNELINKKLVNSSVKEKFLDAKNNVQKDKINVIGKIDEFRIISKYNLSVVSPELKETIHLIKDVVKILKDKNFSSIIYGDIFLGNTINPSAYAEYNIEKDRINVKVFKEYNSHVKKSLIHELTHRIWFKLMNREDRKKWENEFNKKKEGKQEHKYSYILGKRFTDIQHIEGFPPNLHSQSRVEEYFSETITEYILNGEKYSDLIDEII